MTAALASYHLPSAITNVILGSIGGAQSVAARVGGATGVLLSHLASAAFISGIDLGLVTDRPWPPRRPCSRWPCCPPGAPRPRRKRVSRANEQDR